QRQFEPHGVTVVVIIAESHLSIHTWPEHGYAAVDVFTCGDDPEFGEVTRLLGQRLGATSVSTIEVKRGLLAQLEPSAISHPLSAVGLRRSGG
ncbi:MAG: adenosylmethionine decarboxylase, partial [Chloroflexi bacterium]|nr:adenosylmethionine decarboxylase [Chloroflexota bacterium]